MTELISDPPVGSAYVYFAIADALNASWTNATGMQDAYTAKIDTASGTWLDPTVNPQHISATTVTPATSTPPAATATVTAVLAQYETIYDELLALFDSRLPSFISTYFPDDAAVYNAAEDWLLAEINNPDRVLPAALAAVIWEEDRSRITQDSQRATDAVSAALATRRFPLFTGAAASAVLQVQQKAQDQLAASSRAVATKTFEMAYDKLKFCIEKAVSTRQIAMSATLDYMKTLVAAPATSSQVVGMGYGAEGTLRGAAAQYFGAQTDALKLAYAGAEYNARAAQGAAEKNQAADLTMIGERKGALVAEAQGIAQLATAWANNLHAALGASGSDTVSTSY